MFYIGAKFHEIISNGIKVAGGATVVNLCTSSVMLYISTKFCEIILNGIKVIQWTRSLYRKLQRGIILQKCRWSDCC